jgi:hypothetical protein
MKRSEAVHGREEQKLFPAYTYLTDWSDTLSTLSTNQRLKIALGGFISFTGLIILVAVVLSATGATDLQSALQTNVLIGAVALLGVLDVLCGLLLFFREKRLKDLFAPHEKKPDDDVNQPHEAPDSKTQGASL